MKICAITMVYKDYWAASQWYAHYSRHLGCGNLFVLVHGDDQTFKLLCPGANIWNIPRNDLTGFDRRRGDILNSLQDALGVPYDWVIRTDVDELICLSPHLYDGFRDFFRRAYPKRCVFALGFDLVEAAEDSPLDTLENVFQGRRHAVFSGHYSKAFAACRGVHLARHGIVSSDGSEFFIPRGAYLAHLKYANIEALQELNAERIKIASGKSVGLPGRSWRNAESEALRYLTRFEKMKYWTWDVAEKAAYESISRVAETKVDKGIVRARSLKFDIRTVLPEWFMFS